MRCSSSITATGFRQENNDQERLCLAAKKTLSEFPDPSNTPNAVTATGFQQEDNDQERLCPVAEKERFPIF
jgi:hypothetical protein